MLPQENETMKAEEVRASEQDVQPYFEHNSRSEYCCTTLIENSYMNILETNLVCEDCYMTKLSFFEAEVTLLVWLYHIVTKDLYCTLKLSSLDCSLCDTQFFYMRQRADLCVTCAERVIYLCQQEALYNDVDSEASTIIYNNVTSRDFTT